MDNPAKENSTRYRRWLLATGLIGGCAGWIAHGMLDGFLLWGLPLYCIGAAAFTINGDNIFESIVVLVILGVGALILSGSEAAVNRVGLGTILGSYIAICVSKLGFALSKAGIFGNTPFS